MPTGPRPSAVPDKRPVRAPAPPPGRPVEGPIGRVRGGRLAPVSPGRRAPPGGGGIGRLLPGGGGIGRPLGAVRTAGALGATGAAGAGCATGAVGVAGAGCATGAVRATGAGDLIGLAEEITGACATAGFGASTTSAVDDGSLTSGEGFSATSLLATVFFATAFFAGAAFVSDADPKNIAGFQIAKTGQCSLIKADGKSASTEDTPTELLIVNDQFLYVSSVRNSAIEVYQIDGSGNLMKIQKLNGKGSFSWGIVGN